MARIAGVDLPRSKRVEIALTYIYGIGPAVSKKILINTGISPDVRVNNLTDDDIAKIREEIDRLQEIDGLKVEGDLRREITMNIKRLMEINSYRGIRHRRGLPVRGQRTKTNARTRRGAKKTVAGKKGK